MNNLNHNGERSFDTKLDDDWIFDSHGIEKEKMNKFHDFQVFWKSFSETAEGRKEVAQLLMTKVGRKWQLNEARRD